jgi:methionyl-tRNA formyltransferase
MRIVIVTQDELFYLAVNMKYLYQILPAHSQIVGCVVNDASPFGKKGSFISKAYKTYQVFGLAFFVHYSVKYILSKVSGSNNLMKLLKELNISVISLDRPINDKESVQRIQLYKPDILVSILGNEIFKEPIINLAPKGYLNLHTSLLPEYRGLMTTFWVLKNEEKYMDVSVFFVDRGIDSFHRGYITWMHCKRFRI